MRYRFQVPPKRAGRCGARASPRSARSGLPPAQRALRRRHRPRSPLPPFPLPQITGHEVVALDEHGERYAVEINAPPIVRGIETDCPFAV
ncbi:MAG: hypothetical protein R2748_11360 [Bryobacterales bacterium]